MAVVVRVDQLGRRNVPAHKADAGATDVGDRIAMLDKGSVLECSTPREFLNSAHPVVRDFLDSQHIGRNFFNEMENFK